MALKFDQKFINIFNRRVMPDYLLILRLFSFTGILLKLLAKFRFPIVVVFEAFMPKRLNLRQNERYNDIQVPPSTLSTAGFVLSDGFVDNVNMGSEKVPLEYEHRHQFASAQVKFFILILMKKFKHKIFKDYFDANFLDAIMHRCFSIAFFIMLLIDR